eukprot:7000066-Alexandrium_andersonii.AAC.1
MSRRLLSLSLSPSFPPSVPLFSPRGAWLSVFLGCFSGGPCSSAMVRLMANCESCGACCSVPATAVVESFPGPVGSPLPDAPPSCAGVIGGSPDA